MPTGTRTSVTPATSASPYAGCSARPSPRPGAASSTTRRSSPRSRPATHTRPTTAAQARAPPARRHRPPVRASTPTTSSRPDRWGNIVAYTNTINFFGGSGEVVPGYGFLRGWTNELAHLAGRARVLPQRPAPGTDSRVRREVHPGHRTDPAARSPPRRRNRAASPRSRAAPGGGRTGPSRRRQRARHQSRPVEQVKCAPPPAPREWRENKVAAADKPGVVTIIKAASFRSGVMKLLCKCLCQRFG